MDWIKEHAGTLLAVLIVVGALGVTLAIYNDRANAGVDPGRNRHAKACIEAGRTIRDHNHGGEDQQHTFWCVTSDGQITDLWFS